eukprot:gene18116-24550_t
MTTTLIVACLVLFCLGTTKANQCICEDVPGYQFYPQLDHSGQDIRCEEARSSSMSDLAGLCSSSSFCASFTVFTRPSDGQKMYCLKYVSTPLHFQPTSAMGICQGTYLRTSPPSARVYPDLVKSLAVGSFHTCALMFTGKVKCWGQNTYGQLGFASFSAVEFVVDVDLGTNYYVTQLSAGYYHTCATFGDGAIKCWGLNLNGQLGLGNRATLIGSRRGDMGNNLQAVNLGSGVRAISVAAGAFHTCAVLMGGVVKCWGLNIFGQLGLGDITARGFNAYEMGDNLKAIDLGSGEYATDVTCGWFHTCVLLASGRVKCLGYNRHGQLGLADGSSISRGLQRDQLGDNLGAVQLGGIALSVSSKGHHTCALVSTGSGPVGMKCWGSNGYTELGQANFNGYGLEKGSMGDNLKLIDLAYAAVAGNSYSCAPLVGGRLKCWGMNLFGALGLGTGVSIMGTRMGQDIPFVNLGTNVYVSQVAAGFGATTCAILNGGTMVKCWGRNSNGQLGIPGYGDRGDNYYYMGDSLPAVDLQNSRSGSVQGPNLLPGGVTGPSQQPELPDKPGQECKSCITFQVLDGSLPMNADTCITLVSFLESDSCGTAPVTELSGALTCSTGKDTISVCGEGGLVVTDTWQQGVDKNCAGVLVALMGGCSSKVKTTSTCGSYDNTYEITCSRSYGGK